MKEAALLAQQLWIEDQKRAAHTWWLRRGFGRVFTFIVFLVAAFISLSLRVMLPLTAITMVFTTTVAQWFKTRPVSTDFPVLNYARYTFSKGGKFVTTIAMLRNG